MVEPLKRPWEVVSGPVWLRSFGSSLRDFQIDGSPGPRKLLKAEEVLLDWLRHEGSEKYCVVGTSRPEAADEENTVRAGFLRYLLLGGDDEFAVLHHSIDLQGAFINGDLVLEGCRAAGTLRLADCTMAGSLTIRNSEVRGVEIAGCSLHSVNIGHSTIDGKVRLTGSLHLGEALNISHCDVKGDVCLQVDLIIPGRGASLSMNRTVVRGDLKLGKGFRGRGVSLVACRVVGDVDLSDAVIGFGKSFAIDGERIEIGGKLIIGGGFKSAGRVGFRRARVDGDVLIVSGELGQLGSSHEDEHVLDISRAEIIGDLWLGAISTQESTPLKIGGGVDFRYACVRGRYYDDPRSWPPPREGESDVYWCLDGFKYGSFHDDARIDVKTRLDWLMRQPTSASAAIGEVQPYNQLARTYRRMGLPRHAGRVLTYRDRLAWRRRLKAASWISKPFIWLRGM